MLSSTVLDDIFAHCGGRERLAQIGARDFSADDAHVSFKLIHPNPMGVKTVTISVAPNGQFAMDCYGGFEPGVLKARRLSSASGVIPENLATVLGRLTGIESLHHRHF